MSSNVAGDGDEIGDGDAGVGVGDLFDGASLREITQSTVRSQYRDDEILVRLQRIEERMDCLSAEIVNKVTANLQPVFSMSTPSSSSVHGHARARKRPLCVAEEVPILPVFENTTEICMHLLRCAMMVTVYAFGKNLQGAAGWTGPRMAQNMSDASELVQNVSGLSVIFFSVANGDPRAKFNSKIGKTWSWFCSSALFVLIASVRRDRFLKASVQEPDWLRDICTCSRPFHYVLNLVKAFQQSRTLPHLRKSKRGRVEGAEGTQNEEICAKIGPDGDSKSTVLQRERAVQHLRSFILRILSTGRSEARLQVFRNFLFLVECVSAYRDAEAARQDGYEFIVHDSLCSDEDSAPVAFEGTIWDIPKAKVSSGGDKDVTEWNNVAFRRLQESFPSMTVTLKFKKRVQKPSSTSNGRQGDGPNAIGEGEILSSRDGQPHSAINADAERQSSNVHWPVTEKIQLHRAACSVLMGAFKAEDHDEVFRASTSSLRAIHVIAFALRALIRRCDGHGLNATEKKALGDVKYDFLEPGDTGATVMMGCRIDKSRLSAEKKTIDSERRAKLEMSWEAYVVARKERDEEIAMRNRSRIESGGCASDEGGALAHQRFSSSWMIDDVEDSE